MGDDNSECKSDHDEGDYLILGVILGILGTAIYEMVSSAITSLTGAFWSDWGKAIGAFRSRNLRICEAQTSQVAARKKRRKVEDISPLQSSRLP